MQRPLYHPHMFDPDTLARRRLQAAHHRDGLPEIVIGLGLLFVAALIYAQTALPPESLAFRATALALAVFIPLLCLGSRPALRWVRHRYLVKRLGYMEPAPAGRKQIGLGAILAVAVGLALFVVAGLPSPDRWVLAGTGLFAGGLAAVCGRLPRFLVGGALIAGTGIVLAFAGIPLPTGFAVLFGAQGLLAAISGCFAFWRLLRQPLDPGE